MRQILMVEDDAEITALLDQYLLKYGFELFSVDRASSALDKLRIAKFDLVLLDLTLPEMDGLQLCRLIKKDHPEIPIIISTARGDTTDKVIGFDAGADDYIAKPYDPRELIARIQYQIRRHDPKGSPHAYGESHIFTIDEKRFEISKEGEDIGLTMAEYELFSLLLTKRHMVLSREFIINSVSSIDWESSDKSINVIIGRIRQKIGDDIKRPIYIKTIRGVGYQYIGE